MEVPLSIFLLVALLILIVFVVGALLNIQTVLRFRSLEPRVRTVAILFWCAAAAILLAGSAYFLSVDWSQTLSLSGVSFSIPSVEIQP